MGKQAEEGVKKEIEKRSFKGIFRGYSTSSERVVSADDPDKVVVGDFRVKGDAHVIIASL